MPHPDADLRLTAADVGRLVAAQHPSLLAPIRHAAHGWDNELFRLGDDLAARLPRRAFAAHLIEHEQRWLPALAAVLPVPVPAPVAVGVPGQGFPWAWSIVPWFEGRPATSLRPHERDAFAVPLADALRALHTPAPAAAPHNPVRGVPLSERDAVVRERLAAHPDLAAAWAQGVAAPVWDGDPMWLHGDVHPGNLVVQGGRLAALVDFGDMCAGDPACDLAIAWSAFTPEGREAFRDALGSGYDGATWLRAKAWAASFALLSLDAPDAGMRAMAEHARAALAGSA